jgi:four helix bundle protein
MAYAQSFKELTVWKRAMELVKVVYRATAKLPREETFGLTSQMRRCAVSIPSNIAEGYRRKSRKDYLQFLHIADGSAAELETQVLIAKDLYTQVDFIPLENLLTEVQKMMAAFIRNTPR